MAVNSVEVLRGLNSSSTSSSRRHVAADASPSRRVRKTESPLSLRHADEDSYVDKAAEEFIERFYRELMLQKRMAARETADWYG